MEQTQSKELIKSNNTSESLVEVEEKFNNNFKISKLLGTVGTIEFTTKEIKILYDPFDDDDLDILPTGIVYASWVAYMKRMRAAFKGSWGMVPHGIPRLEGNLIMWPFYLIIRGKLAAYSIGECGYVANNKIMTYGDACEGAKSNGLMRNCKAIGVGIETWDRKRLEEWKNKNAESYQGKDKEGNPKTYWRRKDGTKRYLYLRLVGYLLELLGINQNTFLKSKGKVALDLCNIDELKKYKTELEERIKRKFGYKVIINKKDEQTKKMILAINKLFKEYGYNLAKRITLLKKYNLTDINKATEKELVLIYKEITGAEKIVSKEKPEPIQEKKTEVKKKKSLLEIMNTIEKLQKELKLSTKDLDNITGQICKGNALTMKNAEKVIKELRKKLNKKGKSNAATKKQKVKRNKKTGKIQ